MADRHQPALPLTTIAIAITILCLLALLAVACESTAGTPAPAGTAAPSPTATVPLPDDAPEETLRAWVNSHLSQGFVSDCDLARRPADVGKLCAGLRADRNGVLAYGLGPTFSEFTRLFLLEPIDRVWTIIHEETIDPALPGIPWPLAVGASVIVAVGSDCLQIRDQPGLQAVPVDCLENGTAVTISAGPADRDGFQWWRLAGHGWAAGNWLRYPDATP